MKKSQYVDKVYRLTRDEAPLSFMLPIKNSRRFPLLWFDEDKGQQRALRYARNQKSPFEDEQDGNAILEPVIFEDGFLRVPKENQVLQKFLYYHPLNGKRFVEVDNERDATVEVENLNYEVDALIEARQMSIEQMENVGRVLFNRDVTRMSTAELKRDILLFAKSEPKEFLNVINDPQLKIQATVQMFFDKKLLTLRRNGAEIWYNTSSNKTKMMSIPYGYSPVEAATKYLQSDEGIDSLKLLESLNEE